MHQLHSPSETRIDVEGGGVKPPEELAATLGKTASATIILPNEDDWTKFEDDLTEPVGRDRKAVGSSVLNVIGGEKCLDRHEAAVDQRQKWLDETGVATFRPKSI